LKTTARTRRSIADMFVVVVSIFFLLGIMAGVADATPGDGGSPKSMFIDLGAATPYEIGHRVDRICSEHRDPGGDEYIHDVVLVGLVDEASGQLRVDELNAVLPHVPGGGDIPCFDNVFVGPASLSTQSMSWKTHDDFPEGLEPWCADNPYCGGILTESWRWDNIRANRVAADTFLAFVNGSYPGVRSNVQWYVTYEAYFDWLGDNNYSSLVRGAYESYLFQTIKEYRDALLAAGESVENSSRAVLWSPTYENGYGAHEPGQLDSIRANLRVMFRNIENLATEHGITRGLDWVHMQDRIGQMGCFESACYEDVKSWYDFLATVNYEEFSFASLRVNMEGFSTGSPPLGDPSEQMVRQDFYQANGIPIGASWELTWWFNPVPPPPPVQPLTLGPPDWAVWIPTDERQRLWPPGFDWQQRSAQRLG
jgi:hypothetical protein